MRARNFLSEEQKRQFEEDGYVIVQGLFDEAQVAEIRACFAKVQEGRGIPGYFEPLTEHEAAGEKLLMYPRILYPHRILPPARRYMLDPQVIAALRDLFGEEPLAAQSMFYFKPPGARGQALHQDNYYLQAEPGTCIAAWAAIDDADQENGGLVLVPKTQRLDIQCPHEADPSLSFFRDEVDLPEGAVIVPADMKAGDVLFFNGSTIHGSFPNRSADRFRRSFICHYVGVSTLRLGRHIHADLHAADGSVVKVERNESGGPCGTPFAAEPH